MLWQDGFGDELSVTEELERDEMLRTFYRASVHQTAKIRDAAADDFDDLVQEGVIAAWTAVAGKERADARTYGAVSARNRINRVVTGRVPMIGSEAPAGKRIHDQSRQTTKREADFELVSSGVPEGRDAYEAVETRVDVLAAVKVLDRRDQRMAALVGLDRDWEQVGREVGLSKMGAYNRWNRVLKPVLAELLSEAA